VLTILCGLLSAFSYATSDLLSQHVTRRTRALAQAVWVLATGVVIILPVALLVDGLPHGGAQWRAAGLAVAAGVIWFAAFFCLLRALNAGDLGLISALNALQGAYAVVIFVMLGQPITVALAAAVALCACGAVLTSVEGRAKTTRGAPWAFASGFLFACVVVLYGNAGAISWLSQAAISRSVSLAVALPVALLGGGLGMPRRLRPAAATAGVLELGGLVMLTVALSLGPLTVASVTTTQFATFAVILGFVVLHERPRRHQWAGLALTLVGVSVLAALA
jgi:drug/metabolite transporter (DMT)-like permease